MIWRTGYGDWWESRRGGEWFFTDMFWVTFWDCKEVYIEVTLQYLYENLVKKVDHGRDFNKTMTFTIPIEKGLALELMLKEG